MIKNKSIILFVIATWLGGYSLSLASTSYSTGGAPMMTLSSVFEDGGSIPQQYTCQGQNISPPITWTGVPSKTKSLVLIVDDPDAPNGTWDHWILFNIPVDVHSLSEKLNTLPVGTLQGLNSWGKQGYGGPCPPSGEHRYIFRLYALDTSLDLAAGANRASIEAAMKNHVIDQTMLIGKYRKL